MLTTRAPVVTLANKKLYTGFPVVPHLDVYGVAFLRGAKMNFDSTL